MIYKFSKYNESLRDKMTPKTEEDIRNVMGEEKFYIWKNLSDAFNSLTPSFEPHEILLDATWDRIPEIPHFDVRLYSNSFRVSFDGDKWYYPHKYRNNSDHPPIENSGYDTWDDVYKQIVIDSNKYLEREKEIVNQKISKFKITINNIEKSISEINEKL